MNEKIELLRDWGCDIKGALERMLDDQEFYLECLETVIGDTNYVSLRKALEEKQTAQAFDCAHTLKGVLANVGLTPMYEKVVEIVEPLRAGNCDDSLLAKLDELEAMNQKLIGILQS